MSEYHYYQKKLLFVGMPNVGKTSVIKSFNYGYYTPYTNAIIRNEKTMSIYDIQIHDIEFTDDYSIPKIHHDTTDIIIVCDPTNPSSYLTIPTWLNNNKTYYLIINKIDLVDDDTKYSNKFESTIELFDYDNIFIVSTKDSELNFIPFKKILSHICKNNKIIDSIQPNYVLN